MLEVVTLERAKALVEQRFAAMRTPATATPVREALGLVLAQDANAPEDLPPFRRSTVDGFALHAQDTFGCTDAIPAILALNPAVHMGAVPDAPCEAGSGTPVPTGAMLPEGADAVAMVEYSEDYGDGTVGILRPCAPGENVVFAGDELQSGQLVVSKGAEITARHIGAFSAAGITHIEAHRRPLVGIISSGDEIVPADEQPQGARLRDANGPLLAVAVREAGGEPVGLGIVPDDLAQLERAVREGRETCDMVLVTGGSSVGERDNTARVFASAGELLFHGIAVKPGKPTLCVDAQGTPLFGLPGHPVAAYLVFLELVRPLIAQMAGRADAPVARAVEARLVEAIPSNHGRTELVCVRLEGPGGNFAPERTASTASEHASHTAPDAFTFERAGEASLPDAVPLRIKSGLISLITQADGYLKVDRDCEGLPAGANVPIILF